MREQSVYTTIKDVIVNPLYCNSWPDSLKSPHIIRLQLADDFSQTQFPVQILIDLGIVWQFRKPAVIWDMKSLEDSFLPPTVSMIPKQLHSVLQDVTP